MKQFLTHGLFITAIWACHDASVQPVAKAPDTINQKINDSMEAKNFTTSFITTHSPDEVFNAINNVRGWWSENIQGNTASLNDEFFYAYKDVHQCKMKITESIPGKKVMWHVMENQFNFINDKNEWKGNDIIFDIDTVGDQTKMTFTQVGLVPSYECYDVCQDAWTSYIQGSLKDLVEKGQGRPNTKENDLNKELIEKWGLPNK